MARARWRRRGRASAPGGLFLVLFALPFTGAGAGITIYAGYCWETHFDSAEWEKVPATVTHVEFKSHSGSDSTTYSVECRYTYTYQGRKYAGSRVAIMGGSSSSYGVHRRRFETLDAARKAGRPVEALVDPADPERAILFRDDMDAWMYALVPFGLVFFAAGVAMAGGGVVTSRRARRRREQEAELGPRPWLFRDDWCDFRVRASAWKKLLALWGFGVLGALFMSIFHILVTEGDAPLFAKLIVWALTVAIGFVLVGAVLTTVRQVIFGTPELVLNELPVVPGRKLVAVMRTTRRPVDAERVKLTLTCQVKVTRSNRGESSTSYENLHKQELAVDRNATVREGEGSLVPVVADIPAKLPGTVGDLSPDIVWKLEAKARAFPVSLHASFDLPVFKADESEISKRPALL